MSESSTAGLSTPEWLRNDSVKADDSQLLKKNAVDGGDGVAQVITGETKTNFSVMIQWGLRIITMSLCLLMALTALIGLSKLQFLDTWIMISRVAIIYRDPHLVYWHTFTAGSINGVDKSGKIFVAVYMFFFSTVLFVFEGVQIKNVEYLDHVFRRNFGFLYSVTGKAFYIIL